MHRSSPLSAAVLMCCASACFVVSNALAIPPDVPSPVLLLGFVVWDELPGLLALAGASLIAASGLCVLHGAKPRPAFFGDLEPGHDTVRSELDSVRLSQ